MTNSDEVCDVCAGTGTPTSGMECICGGSGKLYDASVNLRFQWFRLTNSLGEIIQGWQNPKLLTNSDWSPYHYGIKTVENDTRRKCADELGKLLEEL